MITKENFTYDIVPNFYKQVSRCSVSYNGLFLQLFYFTSDDEFNKEYNRIVDTLICNSEFIDELKVGFENGVESFNTHNLSPKIIMNCLTIALNTELDFQFDNNTHGLTWEFQIDNGAFYTIYCDGLNLTTTLICH